MRRKFTTLAVAAMLSLVPLYAHAVTFAVVDAQKVLTECNAAKAAASSLGKMRDNIQSQIDGMQKEFDAKRDAYMRKQSVLSDDQRMEEESKLKGELRDYNAKVQNLKDDLNNEVMMRRKSLIDALKDVVTSIAKQKKYDMVIDAAQLLYSSDAVDITDQVMAGVNAKLDTSKK